MKAIIFSICIVFAFAAVRKDIADLITRGDTLVATARKTLNAHRDNNLGHLLTAATFELEELETLLHEIKAAENSTTTETHHINSLEERLLINENRLNEELEFIDQVFKNHKSTKTGTELVEFGQKLEKDAKSEIAKHADKHTRETRLMQIEIREIEHLIQEIQTHPEHNSQNEERLARHEKTLLALTERLRGV